VEGSLPKQGRNQYLPPHFEFAVGNGGHVVIGDGAMACFGPPRLSLVALVADY
jgi:hypothetical protein